ncbi:Uncharacterized membrane protein [Denitrobacterium detoxificans]|uniref:Uncharacterized membrane protein n=2 Tax=Denitrobacterium detoxificans TaxID=79604 RepID=A0A1H8QDV1_9ACTN|nr:Uncharacterized membrane protein [Denitrobacterium detoxificans]
MLSRFKLSQMRRNDGPVCASAGRTAATWGMGTHALRSLVLAVCLMALVLLACAIAPSHAYAKDYTIPKVDITADAQSDGSLHVVEQRTFSFDGTFSCIWWNMRSGSFTVNSVQIGEVDSNGDVALIDMPSVGFDLSWRDAGGPGYTSYSVDTGKNTVYAFFNATDCDVVIQIDYTVKAGVTPYKDCADLYWQYIGTDWAVANENVTCTITMPVPAGAAPVIGSDVYAWGHGPLTGTLAFNDSATAVTYKVDKVKPGEYAEARVVFPRTWLTNISSDALESTGDTAFLDSILQAEEEWADAANYQRMYSQLYILFWALLSVALIVWAVVMYFRHGKEHKPTFTEDYWRDVPNRNVHPATIGRLWRFGKEDSNDFMATIMYLSHAGVLTIAKGTYQKNKKTVEDYYITIKDEEADALSDPIDREAIKLLRKVSNGKNPFWLGSIRDYGKAHPSAFNNAVEAWQGKVTAAQNKADYFEENGNKWQGRLISVALGYPIICFLITFFIVENYIPLVFSIVTGIALFALSNFMTRRTQKGLDDYMRCKALRRWLCEFSALDERPPTDVKVWGEFMVYAYIFGVAKEALAQLRKAVPQIFQEDDDLMGQNSWYVPWYAMYGTRHGDSFASVFDTTWSNTESIVSSALSSSSSSGGFGGGFSGGGGGGFGGGGGGAR